MSSSAPIQRIAVLGVGLMGAPIAKRLLQAGHSVTIWNRTRAKAEPLASLHARIADHPADAVGDADIVITMLEDGSIVRSVLEQAARGLRQDTLIIDMSSTRQSEAQEFHATLAAQRVSFIDAPVSGGVLGAEGGTLAIMVGGSEADFARAKPILEILGRPTRVGPASCGQVAKLCNQLIVGGTLSIVAEALMLAEAGGADPAAVRTAIRGGFAESRILDVHGQRMLERNFLPGGQVKSQTKDLENALIAAASGGVRLPVAELVTELYRSILELVPNADQSAALLAIERINTGKRIGTGPDQLP